MGKSTNSIFDVCVVGGGYSGLVLAIKCAKAGLLVCLIEQNEILGRKILSTGNGRCNFSNTNWNSEVLYSNSKIDISEINYNDSITFFNELGILEKDLDGYLYPLTNQAKTIRDALEIATKEYGVSIYTSTKVLSVKKGVNYEIYTDNITYFSKNIVIATGGQAAPKLGSTGDGYKFAKEFGLHVTDIYPSLVGLKSSNKELTTISGVRALGNVSILDKKCFGEIQFNKDGISGYPIMCLSRFISMELKNNKVVDVKIDFLPNYTEKELINNIFYRFSKDNITIKDALNGLINDKIIDLFLIKIELNEKILSKTISKNVIFKLVKYFKEFTISISDTKGFENAQVTAGGVSLDEIDTNTMMVKNSDLSGLYFIGEILDVDGICGGYNLEWARYSAFKAAESICSKY